MGLEQYKAFLLVVTAVSALLVASPALEQLLVAPQTDYFTELSVFGQYHNATYPYKIMAGENYRLYLDVVNHLGSCAYYIIEMKFRNQTQSAPDSFNHTASDLPSLGNISFLVADNGTLELPIDLVFQYNVDETMIDQVDMQDITLNGATINAYGTTIVWNHEKKGFYGNLFFELLRYNDTANAFQYHQRYVSLWLKMEF